MTDAVVTAPVVGRSLWGDAWARLKANKAAMFSLFYLIFMALICVVGPYFVPHQYTTIYADYVRTPPSLSAYPKADMIETAHEGCRQAHARRHQGMAPGRRARLRHGDFQQAHRRTQRPLCRPFGHVRRRQAGEQVGRWPVGGDERLDQAAIFPVRHRQHRPRPAVANADGRAHLARHRSAGRHRRGGDRRRLRRDGRLHRRQDRRGDDAHRRRALFAALHLLRHHAGRLLRPKLRADVPGRRRRALARHGAHRARPGAVDPAAGICPGRRGAGRPVARHPAAACHPQPARTGGHLHDAAGAAGDHPRKLPVLPRARRAGADDELGRADLRRCEEHRHAPTGCCCFPRSSSSRRCLR